MAKLLPPFILCPLSDSKEFLGMSSDHLENKVILTVGKNIAIRYHVLEQKQEVSWICSRHWFTSRVVYCADLEKYGAVIDYSTVILFDETDSNLANMKKYKFSKPILELKATKKLGTLIVFKNGDIKSLSNVLTFKKQTMLMNLKDLLNVETEKLLYVEVDEKRNQASLVIGFNNELQPCSKYGLEKVKKIKVIVLDLSNISSEEVFVKCCITIENNNEWILGSTIDIFSGSNNSFIYFCSDGYLYQKSLASNETQDIGTQLKISNDSSETQSAHGSKVALLERHVSNSNAVVIKSIDSSSIIIYGCDPSEEGATVFAYDIHYNTLLAKQSLKLYSSPPMMEKLGQHVFVPVGLHILALNLRLTKSRLSSVVGKHQIQGIDFFEKRDPWIASWTELGEKADGHDKLTNGQIEDFALMDESQLNGIDTDEKIKCLSKNFEQLYKLVKTLERDGQPESMICSQIIPQVLDSKDTEALKWTLNYFYDIPEYFLISIATFLLSTLVPNSADADDNHDPSTFVSNDLINTILQRNFDQKQLLRELRAMDFEIVKIFLQYILSRMNELWNVKINCNETGTADAKDQELLQLLKWTCIIFDAHYPQFVFNNETALTEKFMKFINEKFSLLNEVESLEPLLNMVLSKKSYQPKISPNTKYRVETVTFE